MKIVQNIRNEFRDKLARSEFVTDKTGTQTIEIIGAQFIANESAIFGSVNEDWNARELAWYLSLSLNVNDIPPPIPAIWKQVATPTGEINSNYGWCIFSSENGRQYDYVLAELKRNPDSRRAQMIYTRPSMHVDYNRDGMSDFMCCSDTIHYIRDGALISLVKFRSNDAVFGFKGDFAWANYVHNRLADDLGVPPSHIIWNAASLHVYSRHWDLING